ACAVGALGSALSDSLSTLLLFRTLNGAIAAAIIPLSMAWVGDNVPYAERQVSLVHMLSGSVLGLITGQAFGGLLAETLGWRSAFFMLTGLFVIVGGLLITTLYRRPELASAQTAQGNVGFIDKLRGILAIAKARRILTLVFLEGVAAFGALAFVAS